MPRGTSPVLAIVFLGRAMLKFMMPSDSRDCLEAEEIQYSPRAIFLRQLQSPLSFCSRDVLELLAEGRLVSSMIRKPGA